MYNILNSIVPLIFALASLVAISYMLKVLYLSIKPELKFSRKKSKVIPIKIVKSTTTPRKESKDEPDDIIYH